MVLSFWGFYRQSIKNRQILFGLYQFKKKKKKDIYQFVSRPLNFIVFPAAASHIWQDRSER